MLVHSLHVRSCMKLVRLGGADQIFKATLAYGKSYSAEKVVANVRSGQNIVRYGTLSI